MSDDDAAGVKRDREDDPAEADAPAAKEARVESDSPADAPHEPAAKAEEAPAEDDRATEHATDRADVTNAEAPDARATLAEALELLAPKVTKRLDTLHRSGLVAEQEIDAATLRELGEFTPVQAVEIIDQLTEDSLRDVEDKNAFVREVMNRFRAPAPQVPSGGGGGSGAPARAPRGGASSQAVLDALQRLYDIGVIQANQLDAKMHDHLASMPEHAAVAAIEEFGNSDLSGIRNTNGYLKSICRRHEGPPQSGGFDRGGGGFQSGGYQSGAGRQAPPDAFFEIQRRFQMGVITQPVALRLEQFYQDTGASLDSQAWEMMLQLNEMSAMAAIDEVHSACRGDRPVRNPSAYFTGVARKHRAAMEQGQPFAPPPHQSGGFGGYGGGHGGYGGPPQYGGGGGGGYGGGYGGGGPPAYGGGGGGGSRGGGPVDDGVLQQQLPPSLYQRISNASQAGKFVKEALDQRALDTLLKLDEPTAMMVVDEIESTDLGRIRNFAGYFMGICNKFLRGGAPGAPQRY